MGPQSELWTVNLLAVKWIDGPSGDGEAVEKYSSRSDKAARVYPSSRGNNTYRKTLVT